MPNNDAEQGIKELQDLITRLTQAVKISSVAGARIVQNEIIKQMQGADLIASGDLIKSVKIATPLSSIVVQGVFENRVYSDSEYIETVEDGRAAGRKAPPMFRILQWMVLKGISTGDIKVDQQGAYLIARKISQDGIPAKHPFQKGAEIAEIKVRMATERIVEDALQGTRFNAED